MIGLGLWVLLAAAAVSGWQRRRWPAPALISVSGLLLMLLQQQLNAPWRARAGLAPEPLAKAVLMGVVAAIVIFGVYLLFIGINAVRECYRPATPSSRGPRSGSVSPGRHQNSLP